jgi:hypothetical protein
VLRGWIGPSRYLSDRVQRKRLEDAEINAIYSPTEWEWFIKSLRPETKDVAVVADLRIFGSRKELVGAAEEIAARNASLMSLATKTVIDVPTLLDIDRTLTIWRGESALKNPKRASRIGKMGAASRRKKLADGRLAEGLAELFWHDVERYPFTKDALAQMPGWTRTTAWRKFGGREPVEPAVKPKRRKR